MDQSQIYETVSLLQIDKIIRSVDALDSEVTQAMKFAVAATAKMAQRLSNSKLGQDLAVDISAARRRLRGIKASAGKSHRGGKMKRARTKDLRAMGGVWFGLNPLDPIKDFSPGVRQSGKGGVLTTGRDEKMANSFLGKDHGGRVKFNRRGEKYVDKSVAIGSGSVRVFHRKGKDRLPIRRTRIDVNARAINMIAGDIWPKVEAFFYNSFDYNLRRIISENT